MWLPLSPYTCQHKQTSLTVQDLTSALSRKAALWIRQSIPDTTYLQWCSAGLQARGPCIYDVPGCLCLIHPIHIKRLLQC